MCPQTYKWVTNFKITIGGKLDTEDIKNNAKGSNNEQKVFIEPRNKIEAMLVKEYKDVLKPSHDVSVNSNFFEIGGSSLTATIVCNNLKKIPETSSISIKMLF